jgi:hypothetical protein
MVSEDKKTGEKIEIQSGIELLPLANSVKSAANIFQKVNRYILKEEFSIGLGNRKE